MSDTTIGARITVPGFHRWPGATGQRAYLADRHRHLFHVEAVAHVTHDERDVEFHDLQDMLRAWWGAPPRECGSDSCETLARDLTGHLEEAGVLVQSVTVSEDGEAWATHTPTRKA